MRILEFVRCGRKASARPRPGQTFPTRVTEETAVSATIVLTGSGSTAAASTHERRRRFAAGASRSVASHWRPTLGAISEDGVLCADAAIEGKGGRPRTTARPGKAKAAAPAGICNHSRIFRDDYRQFAAPAVFPAFSPTAFLF